MTALIIVGAILLLVLLLALARTGIEFVYGEKGVVLRLRIGFLRIKLVPSDKKKLKKDTKKEEIQKGGAVGQLRELWPHLKKALSRQKHKPKIDRLFIRFTAAASDPAAAAIMFGGSNALIGIILPVLENNFNIVKREIKTDVDYSADKPSIYIDAVLTLALWQAVYIALAIFTPYMKQKGSKHKDERSVQK
ncbi:MAG: DUF2953 domain-containing protein [Oscillospiraceae bacterium]|jgi:hypothetical protein